MSDYSSALLSTCAICHGTGQDQNRRCKDCGGTGRSYYYQKNYLYWDRPFGQAMIAWRGTQKLLSAGIDLFLYLLLLLNIFLIVRLLFAVDFSPVSFWQVLMSSGVTSEVLLIWLLFGTHLYVLFRFIQAIDSRVSLQKSLRHQNSRLNVDMFVSSEVGTILDRAWSIASGRRIQPLRPLHIAEAIIDHKEVSLIFARLGLDRHRMQHSVTNLSKKLLPQQVASGQAPVVGTIVLEACLSAVSRRHRQITVGDLLLALVKNDEALTELLYDYKVDYDMMSDVLTWVDMERRWYESYRQLRQAAHHRPRGPINKAYTATATPYLDLFSQDTTARAKAGALSLTVGRDREINDMYQVLKTGARGLLLVGEQGVGKQSIIDDLASRMVADEVPQYLQDKRLVTISLPALISGAAEVGEMQARLMHLWQEAHRSNNIVLCIPNLHTLVGVSSAGSGGVDLSEVLAHLMERSNVIVIASTTPQHYTELIERSPLSSVFDMVKVLEPDKRTATLVMEANAGYWEAKYKVFFTYASLAKAVELADRYIHEQFLPEKAIQILESVAAHVGSETKKGTITLITPEQVAEIVSNKTSIPLSQVTAVESQRLLHLAEDIHRRIIGQDEAVDLVVNAVQRARTELRDKKRPIATLLFLGPTGVGKTELSKALAESYFGSEDRMIRLDMSEYQQGDSVARLIGVPGSARGGLLTEAVRKQPFALLLLDEIEKAHPDILNIFLQVMEDGRLTDALGQTIDFTNIILIATSNAASGYIQEQLKNNISLETIKDSIVKDQLTKQFRAEFLNRFDGIVIFKPLSPEELFAVAGLLLQQVAARLIPKGISLTVSKEAQAEFAQQGFDPVFGARPLRRLIQDKVDNALAQYLLQGAIGRRDKVILKEGGVIEVDKAEKFT